jgi:hypothetical protein
VRSEYLTPAVSVADSGDFAGLAYNLNTYALDDNGNERQRQRQRQRMATARLERHRGLPADRRRAAHRALQLGIHPGPDGSHRLLTGNGLRRVSVTHRSSLLGPRRRPG